MTSWRSYWGYYQPARPKEVKGGIKTRSQRGAIGETWWSRRWIDVLESFHMGARLGRGRSYARRGQVVSIDVQKGVVTAKVQGTRRTPYSVKIRLNPISDKNWDKVAEVMASQAIFAAKLLSGEMPQNIEDAFAKAKVPLFPTSGKDLNTDCSCPDWANPCKHIAAVYYLLAERFDGDPFLIFKLRGRSRDEIIETLHQKRSIILSKDKGTISDSTELPLEAQVAPLKECLEAFWEAGRALDSFSVNPAPPEVENAILRRMGEGPFMIGKENIVFFLEKAYSLASVTALQKASGEPR